jgi:hypothetical protein
MLFFDKRVPTPKTIIEMAALIVALALGLLASPAQAEGPAAPTAAAGSHTPSVVLESDEILEGQMVPVRIYFSDALDAQALDQICVRLFGPKFLKLEAVDIALGSGKCEAWPNASVLGPFKGDRPVSMSLHAEGKVQEGKATLLFSVAYTDNRPHVANIEKTVDVGVLGIGSISGVPVQLAILVLPGLIGEHQDVWGLCAAA